MRAAPDPRRAAPALQLERSPLILVLAQVGMTPVAKIAEFVPDIQDLMRRNGYPKLTRKNTEIQQTDGSGTLLGSEKRVSWEFIDVGEQWSITVSERSLAIQTTYYTVFEDFVRRFRSALELIHQVIGISGVLRIGLRYLDVVAPRDGETFQDYLAPPLLGLHADCLGERKGHFYESISETEHGTIVLRCVEQPSGGLALDPNLLPIQLTFRYQPQRDSSFCLLDIDHFKSFNLLDFSGEAVEEYLWKLHGNSSGAFRAAVTEGAMERWK